MKSKLSILLSVVLAVILIVMISAAGCKGAAIETTAAGETTAAAETTTAAETTAAAEEPVKLLMWVEPTTRSAVKDFSWEKYIEQYKADTGATTEIKVVEYPFGGLSESVLVALQSDTFPDMYLGSTNRIMPLVRLGVFSEIPDGTIDKSQWEDKAFELGNFMEKQYYVAYHTTIFPLLVNKKLFEKAGISDLLPNDATRTWTRDNYMKAIQAIAALGNGIYGVSFDLTANDTDKGNDGYVWADGNAWADETYVKATFNTPKSVENYKWITEVMKSKYAYPNAMSVDIFGQLDDFIKGKIGILNAYLGDEVNQIAVKYADGSASKDVIDPYYVLFPTDDGSPGQILTLNDGLAVKAQSDPKKVAATLDFYKWLYNPEKSMLLQALINQPDPSLLIKGITTKQDFTGKEEFLRLGQFNAIPGLKQTITAAAIPGFQKLRQIWFENTQAVYSGSLTPEAARDKMQEDGQKAIDEALAAIPKF